MFGNAHRQRLVDSIWKHMPYPARNDSAGLSSSLSNSQGYARAILSSDRSLSHPSPSFGHVHPLVRLQTNVALTVMHFWAQNAPKSTEALFLNDGGPALHTPATIGLQIPVRLITPRWPPVAMP
jgi:hypothetical protein